MYDGKQAELVRTIVRDALRAAVLGRMYEPPVPEDAAMHAPCGCFVTLKTDGQLRGCLGCFVSTEPLYLTVARLTADSALEDPRFADMRLTEAELPHVHFDVSILSPLEPCPDPESIELGRHGILIRRGGRSGCFLPQVATETGWSVAEFWGNCCSHKAGLPANAWRGADVERYMFTAEIIEGVYAPE